MMMILRFVLPYSLLCPQHLPQDAGAISQFLFTAKSLDRNKVGEYLGEGDAFNVAVLHAFCAHLDFADLDFDIAMRCAIRLLLNGLAAAD